MFKKLRQILSPNKISQSKAPDLVYKLPDSFETFLHKLNTYFAQHPAEQQQFSNELYFLNHLTHVPEEDKLLYSVMPYSFTGKYTYSDVKVFRDEEADMFYVHLDGKKLYYHQGFTDAEEVQKSFTYISAEQDLESPHRYIDNTFFVKEGDTVIDLGAAEGNFSLSVVETVKELFIVEADKQWIPALYKTFERWKDKVHIINKFAGTRNSDTEITLTELAKLCNANVVKMDIEGMEMQVLQDAKAYLSKENPRLAVTTYHHQNDAKNIQDFLLSCGYQTAFSDKFILFVHDTLSPPYFRKGVLKAERFNA